MQRLRSYHAVLASLALLSFASGEMGLIHAWLGYGVAAVIILRLGLIATGETQLGLMRFYPHFEGLRLKNAFTHPAISRALILGIAAFLIAVAASGIAMGRGRAIGLAHTETVTLAVASYNESNGQEENDEHESPLAELHEALANLLMLFVGAHVAYLFMFKRPLAKYMLFLSAPGSQKKDPDRKSNSTR